MLGVSRASIYRWAELLETFGSVTPPPPPIRGRPRIIGIAVMTVIKDIYACNCDDYLDKLCWHLAIFHNIAISKSAFQATLVRAGLTQKILHKIASERDKMHHAEFLHSTRTNFSGTGNEFVFIDESSKNEHTLSRLYGCAPMGQDATVEAPFICGQYYSLVAAMSKSGYLMAQVIPGALDAFAFLLKMWCAQSPSSFTNPTKFHLMIRSWS